VTVTNITVVTRRRLSEGEQRRLQGPKLKVEYELVTTSLAEATTVQETLADPTAVASFSAAFSTALVAKEAASGRTVVVKDIVAEPATVTSETVAVVVTPAPAPVPGAPAPGPSPAPVPAPAPPAAGGPAGGAPADATPAPAPAPAEEEEESDNGAVIGGVVGGVAGLGVLGGAVYMFKKKSAQE